MPNSSLDPFYVGSCTPNQTSMSEALYVEILKRYIFNIISYVRNLWCKAFNFLNSTMNNDKLGKTPING